MLMAVAILFARASVSAQSPSMPHEMNRVLPADDSSVIAIVGGRLMDGHGGPPVENSCIVVRGEKIVQVGSRQRVRIPAEAVVVDASGKSVLPGLFDSHFHSRNSVSTPVEYELNNGITSFRDPGHPFRFYDLYLKSQETLPRLFLCGGHLDATPAVWPDQAEVIHTTDEAITTVNEHINRGASAIKVYFRLPLDHIRTVCQAAAQRNVLVTAHLEIVDADAAIEAGVRGIEHITSFGTSLAEPLDAQRFRDVVTADSSARNEWRHRLWQRLRRDDNPRLEPLLDRVVRSGVFVSPTLAIFEARPGDQDTSLERVEGFANMMWFFEQCHRAGARIVVGSHTAAPYAPRGKAYLREVQLMAQAGMQPLEILTAATKTNAEFFGVADHLGTIEPGKIADLILIDGDPSQDINELDAVSRVMLAGRWVR